METVIELGVDRGAPVTRPRRPARVPRRERAVLVLAAAAVLLGPGAPPPAPRVATGAVVPPRAAVLTAGETLLVIDPPVLSAYDVAAPGGPARWRARVDAAAAWSVEPAGDLLLVTGRDAGRAAVTTTARDVRSGESRWRRPERVYAAGDTAVAVTEVRSAADPGRRVQGVVHGVDPATGRTRWSAPIPSTAVVTPLPGRVLVVHDSGLARLHDGRRGTVLAEGRLPPADYAPDNPQVVAGRLVLRHPVPGGLALSGYDLPGLVRRWQRPLPGDEVTVRRCGELVCLHDRRSRWAVRPDTGGSAWSWPGGEDWRALPGGRRGGAVVLLRPAADGARQVVAVAGPDGPRVLGVLPASARDCRADAAVRLVCRAAGGLTVWTWPEPGRT